MEVFPPSFSQAEPPVCAYVCVCVFLPLLVSSNTRPLSPPVTDVTPLVLLFFFEKLASLGLKERQKKKKNTQGKKTQSYTR